MGLEDVVLDYETGTYTVTRTTPGVPVDGIIPPGTPSTFTIDASVQPVDGATLKDMPEGQLADESRVIFTQTELKTRTKTTEPDVIQIDGFNFRITKVQFFTVISNHYRCYAQKLDVP